MKLLAVVDFNFYANSLKIKINSIHFIKNRMNTEHVWGMSNDEISWVDGVRCTVKWFEIQSRAMKMVQ